MELPSHLNSAHRESRTADKLIRQGKHQQAIDAQQVVIQHLQAALLECQDSKVSESLRLQIEHHHKQEQVIRYRQARINNITRNIAELQKRMENATSQDTDNLPESIYRTFKETESLIEHLKLGTAQEGRDENHVLQEKAGEKMPKNDKEIIEELEMANKHLRYMVETMFAQLDTCRKENAGLKIRISQLESEKAGQHPPLKMTSTESVGASTATQVPRLYDDELQDSEHLPPLAPLELPDFDFSVHQPK